MCNGMSVHQCELHGGFCIYVKAYSYIGSHWNCRKQYAPVKSRISQELHIYFSRTMPSLILHKLQKCGFVDINSVCLPAVQTLYFIFY